MSADTMWDLKVPDTAPSRSGVLQLLAYWVALREGPDNSVEIAYVEIDNSHLDIVWRIAVAEYPRE